MTATRRARPGILLAIVLAAGIAATTRAQAPAQTPCTPVQASIPAPTVPASVIGVPMTIRYMMIEGPGGVQDADMMTQNTDLLAQTQKVEALFAPPTGSQTSMKDWNVNDIWGRAGIRVYPVRTERCWYQKADVGDRMFPKYDPANQNAFVTLFKRLTGRHNAPGFRGLDMYVWYDIDGAGGWGSPTTAGGTAPRTGGVWLSSVVVRLGQPYNSCLPTDPKPCIPHDHTLLTAHEIGHFFALLHRCSTKRDTGNLRPQDADVDLPPCPDPGTSGLVMGEKSDGIGLPQLDRATARATAAKLTGTPQP